MVETGAFPCRIDDLHPLPAAIGVAREVTPSVIDLYDGWLIADAELREESLVALDAARRRVHRQELVRLKRTVEPFKIVIPQPRLREVRVARRDPLRRTTSGG